MVDKDLLIQHKEKLYIELKNILARQPGPEVAEQLALYQQSLQERTKQMDLMNAELSLSHTQVEARPPRMYMPLLLKRLDVHVVTGK